MKIIISGIYSITNIINGKRYVGSTENIYRRWREHRYYLKRKIHHTSHLQHAWDKYGQNAFIFEILEYVKDINDLIEIEQYYIDWLNTNNKNFGYNSRIKVDSSRGYKHSDEARKKISESKLGSKNPMYGKHPSKETLAKKSKAMMGENNPNFGKQSPKRGIPVSQETRLKQSTIKKGKNNPMYGKIPWNKGKPHSEETKAKISATKKKNFRKRA